MLVETPQAWTALTIMMTIPKETASTGDDQSDMDILSDICGVQEKVQTTISNISNRVFHR